MKAIFKKELQTYFRTPSGYIFIGLFLLLGGVFFTMGNLFPREPRYTLFLNNALFVFLLVVPLLTMRLLAEEKKHKTDQLLLTAPIRIWHIVMGKFLASVVLFLISLGVTIIYPILLSIHGPIDLWESLGAYLGFALAGSAFIALGIFVSSFTENQLVSSFLTFFLLLVIWLIPSLSALLPVDPFSGFFFVLVMITLLSIWLYRGTKSYLISGLIFLSGCGVSIGLFAFVPGIFTGIIVQTLKLFSLNEHFYSFSSGLIQVSDVVYYLSFSAFFVFLAYQMVDKRRWM